MSTYLVNPVNLHIENLIKKPLIPTFIPRTAKFLLRSFVVQSTFVVGSLEIRNFVSLLVLWSNRCNPPDPPPIKKRLRSFPQVQQYHELRFILNVFSLLSCMVNLLSIYCGVSRVCLLTIRYVFPRTCTGDPYKHPKNGVPN